MEGYRPLQDPPVADLVKARKLLGYLKNVIHIGIDVAVGSRHRGSALLSTCGQLTCFHTPQSKCLQAFTWSLLVPGALQLAKWDSMVPGANLNRTGLCGSQSYEVPFPVCKR